MALACLVVAQPANAEPAHAEPITPLDAPALQSTPASHADYTAMIEREAGRQGIPAALAQAVTTVESGWNPAAIGTSGEIGLMQIMPATASMLGFRGTLAQLADPAVNVELGVRYLSGAWARAGGDLCTALMKYRAGHGETVMSVKSMEYCQRAQHYLASVGSPLAHSTGVYVIPVALGHAPASQGGARQASSLLTSTEWVRLKTGHRTSADSERFWAARAVQLQALRVQLAATRGTRAALTQYAHLTPSHHGGSRSRLALLRRWRAARAAQAARFAAQPVAIAPNPLSN